MSRYCLNAFDPSKYEVVVGYDRPMKTFFAQVEEIRGGENGDELYVVEEGDFLNIINNIEKIENLIKPFAKLDQITKEKMLAEQEADKGVVRNYPLKEMCDKLVEMVKNPPEGE